MPAKATAKLAPAKSKVPASKTNVHLVYGPDEFLVHARAKQLVDSLVGDAASDFALETVEGRVDNSSQAVAALKRVDESLNTLPMFGGTRTIWLKNVNFLGGSRTGESEEVVAQLESLAELLKRGLAPGFALVISAIDLDTRRSFYKTLEKVGEVIAVAGGADTRGKIDVAQLEAFARDQVKSQGKQMRDEALQALIELTGANYRALASEVEKLATFVGDRMEITADDVAAIGSASHGLVVWTLADSIAERKLSKALKQLDQLLFQGESAIRMLFALINKMRMLLLVRELIDRNVLIATPDFGRFNACLQRVPSRGADGMPSDRRFNPLLAPPFVLFKTAQQAANYTRDELRHAMELLLDANKRLVSSSLDEKVVMEQTLIMIIQRAPEQPTC